MVVAGVVFVFTVASGRQIGTEVTKLSKDEPIRLWTLTVLLEIILMSCFLKARLVCE